MNLATAVAICCYELSQIQDIEQKSKGEEVKENGSSENTSDSEIASIELMEGYYQQLESLLLKIGYLYPHTVASRMEKFRQLYNRAQLQNREVAMLRGILRQVEWALSSHKNHENL